MRVATTKVQAGTASRAAAQLTGLALVDEPDRKLTEGGQQHRIRDHPAGEVGVTADGLAADVDRIAAGHEHRVEHDQQHGREDQAEEHCAAVAPNADELVARLHEDEPEVADSPAPSAVSSRKMSSSVGGHLEPREHEVLALRPGEQPVQHLLRIARADRCDVAFDVDGPPVAPAIAWGITPAGKWNRTSAAALRRWPISSASRSRPAPRRA